MEHSPHAQPHLPAIVAVSCVSHNYRAGPTCQRPGLTHACGELSATEAHQSVSEREGATVGPQCRRRFPELGRTE
jgi:hypothetical protein